MSEREGREGVSKKGERDGGREGGRERKMKGMEGRECQGEKRPMDRPQCGGVGERRKEKRTKQNKKKPNLQQ